jgi:hypothetical protein
MAAYWETSLVCVSLVAGTPKRFRTRETTVCTPISRGEGLARALRAEYCSEQFVSEIVARRHLSRHGEDRQHVDWHILGCWRREVPLHLAREHRQEPLGNDQVNTSA